MGKEIRTGTVRISVPTPIDRPDIMEKIAKETVVPTAHGHVIKASKSPKANSKEVKREAKAEAKPEAKPTAEPKPAKREHKVPTDDELLAVLMKAFKGQPLSSREISDAAGISDPEVGRAAVRNAMKRLAEAGKVKTVEAEKGRAALLYKPKA